MTESSAENKEAPDPIETSPQDSGADTQQALGQTAVQGAMSDDDQQQ